MTITYALHVMYVYLQCGYDVHRNIYVFSVEIHVLQEEHKKTAMKF